VAETDTQTDTQRLYNGFGHTLARAFELVVTPSLFGLIGYGIDRALGTLPIFTIFLTVFCIIGMSVKMYYGYVVAMEAHEAAGPWSRKSVGAAAPAPALDVEATQ